MVLSPVVNSISTNRSFPLIEFTRFGLLILRYGLPNNPKTIASTSDDLP